MAPQKCQGGHAIVGLNYIKSGDAERISQERPNTGLIVNDHNQFGHAPTLSRVGTDANQPAALAGVSQRKHKDLGHHVAMKLRRSAALPLSLTLLLVAAPTALADPTPTPPVIASPLSELDQYKIALEQFRIQINLREDSRREIAKTFISSVKEADIVYKAAMRIAKSDKAKIAILAQRESDVELAMKIRDNAIVAMGAAPVEPIKPVKPVVTAAAKKTKGK